MSQCWAMSLQRQRCEYDAGHAGDHGITISWNDDEAGAVFVTTPATDAPVELLRVTDRQVNRSLTTYSADPPPEVDPLVSRPAEEVVVAAGTPCISCHHAHQGGDCARCECHGYIPS